MTPGESVLIIDPAWVGDMVMTQPLVALLQQRPHPVEVDVAAPSWSAPLIRRMPGVRDVVETPFRHGRPGLTERYRLGRELRDRRYHQAIVLPNSFKSALLPRFAGIPLRTGWRGEWRDVLLNDCRRLDTERFPLMVQRFAALALSSEEPLPDPLPQPCLRAETTAREQARQSLQLMAQYPVLALCPGAEFGDAKQWPAQQYAALASSMIARGWQVWLFGSGNDRPIAEEIFSHLESTEQDRCHNLSGRTTLSQAIDLLSAADAVVSNDSGLMHVAAALQRPVVALFGSTSWSFTPPLGRSVAMLATDIDCRPCFQRRCPLGHRDCLVRLSAEDVERQLQSVLEGYSPGAVTVPMRGAASAGGV